MNFNCPVAKTSESIEPNDNNLELNAIAYTFSKIDSNLNFNNSFGDRELLASVFLVSHPRRATKLKKKEHSLCCGRFHSDAVAFRNRKTRREGKTKAPNRQRSKTLMVKHCQNKTSKPHKPRFHSTRPGRRLSGPPYFHSVYSQNPGGGGGGVLPEKCKHA